MLCLLFFIDFIHMCSIVLIVSRKSSFVYDEGKAQVVSLKVKHSLKKCILWIVRFIQI